MSALRELVYAGLNTETLEIRLRELFATDPAINAKLNKSVESIEPNKRAEFKALLVDMKISDLILASHMHESGF